MKKLFSSTLIALLIATTVAGCADIDPKRVGESDTGGKSSDQIDKLLAPPTADNFYESKTVLKMTAGSAEVKRADGKTETVTAETAVAPGDTIKILAKGAGVVTWFDDSISRLKEGTELTIDKADFNTENLTETKINFHVVSGEVWSKVRALVDKKSEFLSYSGNVVSGVRGSTYNMIVTNEGVAVESIAHAAFMADFDPATKFIGKEKTLVRGQVAKAGRVANGKKVVIEVGKIPPKRLSESWMTENEDEDVKVEKVLRQKTLNRLLDRAGALPGDPGYTDKMKQIDNRLAKLKDPIEKSRLEARIAQMKANELLALALKNPEGFSPEGMGEQLDALKGAIENSGLSDDLKHNMMMESQREMRAWDRSLEDVLPFEEKLYKAKEMLRNGEMEMSPTSEIRGEIESKILQRRYFELGDAMEKSPALSDEYLKEMEQVKRDYEKASKMMPQEFNFQLPSRSQWPTAEEIKNSLSGVKQMFESDYFRQAMNEAGVTEQEYNEAMQGLNEAMPEIQKILNENPDLKGQIPTIDPALLNSLPTIDPALLNIQP
ncbi:hypothetical protein HZA44_02195 [Candidatus Peregrinibacteria bacterium]|nr:hypothetical protein [Candidatus Peregrinibacteria bacterium]